MRTLDLALPLLCIVGVGCSAPIATSAEADAEVATSATAVVVIERTVSAGDSARAEAVARFVRMRSGSVDDDALRMVGAAIDLPAMGTCASMVSARASEPAGGAARAVELADLGPITVEASGARVALQARRLPEVVDLVSGVVYSTRAAAAEALPAEASYVLRAYGRADLDVVPFAASATAPGEPASVLVAGQDAKRVGGVVVPLETSAELSWDAGNPDDVVYVDVAQTSGAGPRNVRCLFDDSGRGVVSANAFGDGDGTLTLHRLHKEAFVARGIEAGEIRFDFARVVPFRR